MDVDGMLHVNIDGMVTSMQNSHIFVRRTLWSDGFIT